MSETKWSPEPWRIGQYHVKDADDGCVVAVSRIMESDARRAIAAVNACAGLSTEALESGALARLLALFDGTYTQGDIDAALRALGRLP